MSIGCATCARCKNFCVIFYFILEMTSSDTKKETVQETEKPGEIHQLFSGYAVKLFCSCTYSDRFGTAEVKHPCFSVL